MAKNREGSVIIYGSMQAKTSQGIIGYTDGIAHEKEDGTIVNLSDMINNGELISKDQVNTLIETYLTENTIDGDTEEF